MLRLPLATAVVAVVLGLTLAEAAAGPTALVDAGSAIERRDGSSEGSRITRVTGYALSIKTEAQRLGPDGASA